MTEHDIESRLRCYRPPGPPERLRLRVLAVRGRAPIWRWATAAAALLVLTFAADYAAESLRARAASAFAALTSSDGLAIDAVAADGLDVDEQRALLWLVEAERARHTRETSLALDADGGLP